MAEKIKAVLFDMDGVLVDAKEWHYEALNHALELFGQKISRYEHLTAFDGLPTRKKLQMLTTERGFPKELHEFVNEMKQIYTERLTREKCYPTFAHEFALNELKRAGYQLGVCSNSVRSSVDLMMERTNLQPLLDVSLSNEDVEHGKPAPDMYQKAMKQLKRKPKECLIIEDNENGIAAARAAGGHLLVVEDIYATNYANITQAIKDIEAGKTKDA